MHSGVRVFPAIVLLCSAVIARADLVATPSDLQFPIGYIGITSAPKYVTLRNTGNTALSVVGVTAAGGAYARAGGTCATVPFPLAAQASCTLGYTFTPFFVGQTTATLAATPDTGSAAGFRLIGVGEVGGLRASPGQSNFPLLPIGASAGPMDVTLSNTSAAALTVVSLTPASSPYTRVGGSCGNAPFPIPAQGSCTLSYTFAAVSLGTVYQKLNAIPDVGAFASFTLAGEADQGRLKVEPRNITYLQDIPVGTLSQEEVVTLSNIGRVPMQVTAITPFMPPPVASFIRTGGTCPPTPFTMSTVFACTLAYTFAPIAVGRVTLDINVFNSTASAETVTLDGTGSPEIPLFRDGFDVLAPASAQ